MEKFEIQKLLGVLKQFEKEEGATERTEESLRTLQAKKDLSSPDEVKEIDKDILFEVLSSCMVSRCVGPMLFVICQKYTESE